MTGQVDPAGEVRAGLADRVVGQVAAGVDPTVPVDLAPADSAALPSRARFCRPFCKTG